MTSPDSPRLLTRAHWQEASRAHAERAEELTATWQQAHEAGERHPVEDFLFEYYMIRPTRLARWHPGVGTVLENAQDLAHTPGYEPWYVTRKDGAVSVDAAAYLEARSHNIDFIESILRAVATSSPRFSCFGMHEWAMVYRQEEHRHPLPLRLGQEGTDAVVDSHTITCSHYDAYRFFTPSARGHNTLHPTRETQCALDQAGCLHANMDLYKYASRLGPLCPGDLLLDCFALARQIRWLDMEASPYDMAAMGGRNVPVETPAGKEEYVHRQRAFSARAQMLRTQLLDVITQARAIAE